MAAWEQIGSEIECHDCLTRFPIGHSCKCDQSAALARETAPDSTLTGVESGADLLTYRGQLDRLAELAYEVRHATEAIEVKRVEAELKIINRLIEATTKRETVDRLDKVEDKLDAVDKQLAGVRGFAGRLSMTPIGSA